MPVSFCHGRRKVLPPENNRARRNLRRESSTRYRNKWAVGIFKDWQRVRSVEFPILEVGGVFNEYELHKVQPLIVPTSNMDVFDAQLLVIKICSRDGKVFQISIPSENVESDCMRHPPIHGGKEPSHRVQSLDSSSKGEFVSRKFLRMWMWILCRSILVTL